MLTGRHHETSLTYVMTTDPIAIKLRLRSCLVAFI